MEINNKDSYFVNILISMLSYDTYRWITGRKKTELKGSLIL